MFDTTNREKTVTARWQEVFDKTVLFSRSLAKETGEAVVPGEPVMEKHKQAITASVNLLRDFLRSLQDHLSFDCNTDHWGFPDIDQYLIDPETSPDTSPETSTKTSTEPPNVRERV